jgi:protein gp37
MSTKIQWTDETWNPTTGCTKISPGCANCYIERTPAFRIAGRKFDRQAHIPLQLHDNRLLYPLRWKKPRRVFVNSLSDLFHEDVPVTFIGRVFGVMAEAHWHTFQVLTKRPARMLAWSRGVAHYPKGDRAQRPLPGWPPNVWLGVSVENQHFADERIPLLLQTPAAVRFVSYEPALAAVDFRPWLDSGDELVPMLNWIIVGGESGPGARPFDVAWARTVIEDSRGTETRVFVKQFGAHVTWNGIQGG